MEKFLTPAEVGRLLEVSAKTLANWRSLGIGPEYVKLGTKRSSHVRYRPAAVQSYMDSLHAAA